jgi:hypothetical protein
MLLKLTALTVLPHIKEHEAIAGKISTYKFTSMTNLVVYWSEFLTTDHEVPGSIPGSAMGIFP